MRWHGDIVELVAQLLEAELEQHLAERMRDQVVRRPAEPLGQRVDEAGKASVNFLSHSKPHVKSPWLLSYFPIPRNSALFESLYVAPEHVANAVPAVVEATRAARAEAHAA